MPKPSKQTQETTLNEELFVISSTLEPAEAEKTIRICWNTGEEKNCHACYLSKGCKAKS